jgi:hypothetical protein
LPPTGLADSFGETVVSRGTSYRIDIAMVALRQIAEVPLAGVGANMFRNLMEMKKPIELDIGLTFPFVHNDYLQIWLEFGLVGLVLLGAVIVAALALVLDARRLDRGDPLPLLCGAAATAIFAHAVVDFPLYIPFLLLILGLWLGALAARGARNERLAALFARGAARLRPVFTPLVTGTASVAALAWLAQPVFAEVAGHHAITELMSGRVDTALYWQAVARRLEPHNGAHYWSEGTIWRDQAVESRNRVLAAKADMLFADGMREDPYQIANYIERARFHRQHADLLSPPAVPQELLLWSGEALRLRPYSLISQAEHARTLAFVGRAEDARMIVRTMLERHRETDMARRLAAEFGLQGPETR